MTALPLKVLIIEDSKLYRSYALNALKGHTRFTAETLAEGLDLFIQEKPHVTFLDINLPDGNGLDLLKKLKALDKKAFVVIMTGTVSVSMVQKSQAYGAAGYIAKPFNIERIHKCIDQYMRFAAKLKTMTNEQIELKKAKKFAEVRKKSQDKPGS